MSRIDEVTNGPIRAALSAQTLSQHAFGATGAASATVRTTNAIVSRINGIIRTRAALTGQSLAPTHDIDGNVNTSRYVQPSNTTVYYVLGVDAAGSVAVVQGTWAGQPLFPTSPTQGLGAGGAIGTQRTGDGLIPSLPAGFAPFGLLRVVTGASATFNPGVTNLDAAGVTATAFDIGLIPAGLV